MQTKTITKMIIGISVLAYIAFCAVLGYGVMSAVDTIEENGGVGHTVGKFVNDIKSEID